MANTASIPRNDPIRAHHYRPLERTESIASWLFYAGGLVSFLPLIVDQKTNPKIFAASLVLFVILVVCNFVVGTAIRLYFFPRAEDARRKEFLSNTFGFDLIHERTTGYYNNNETNSIRRLGAATLENQFFSKSILRKMAPAVRFKVAGYLVLWAVCALWRDVPLDWVAAGAQVLFTEQVFSRWLRLEWARNRAENLYESTHRLFQMDPSQDFKLAAYVVASFVDYEAGKALGGILLSQDIFDRENTSLSAEWEIIKRGLPLPKP